MPTNPPEDTPRIAPYLYYEDVAGALAWLSTAFSFQEKCECPDPMARSSMRK